MSISAISSSSGWEELYGLSSSGKASSSQGLASRLFKDLNADQSDGISLEESGLDQQLFSALDSDSSGAVSSAELEAALENAAMFARMQADGVGLIPPPPEGQPPSAQDILAAILNADPAEQAVAASDEQAAAGGGSGSSDDSEEYDDLDSNEDGVVSPEELRAATEKGSLGSSMTSMLMGLFSTLANNSYSTSAAASNSEFNLTV